MPGKLSQEELERFLSDIRNEPQWRISANREMAYFDNKQLDSETLSAMKDRGIPPLVRNMIQPTIRLVLGMNAKTPRDWVVRAEDEEYDDVAQFQAFKLKQMERVTRADQALSKAYKSQVCTGLGWVEVARESNPFKPPYRVKHVHRNEIYWDWRAKEWDLSDARYLVRWRWMDGDVLKAMFPKHKKLIEKANHAWADWDFNAVTGNTDSDITNDLAQGYDAYIRTTLEAQEWCDVERKRMRLYEVWYRRWVNKPVMLLPDGRAEVYDENNPKHVALVATNVVRLKMGTFPTVRLAWWIGPHMLADIPSPYPHDQFPYIPCWGEREDDSGVPYGLIRLMMSPQDEINARLSKMMWQLSAKHIIADSDAFDMPFSDVLTEASRPDGFIRLNPNRQNRDSTVQIESDYQLSNQQFQVLQNATTSIQDVAGVYQQQLGKAGAADSGIAISSLVEQGNVTLASLNQNYMDSRQRVGELLLSLIVEDIGDEYQTVEVEADGRRRSVEINKPAVNTDTGYSYLSNSLVHTRTKVAVSDVPQTESFKLQQMQMISEVAKSMPPDVQPLFADFFIQFSDIPQKEELLRRVRNAIGIQPDMSKLSPEEQQAIQEQQAKQAQIEDLQIQEQAAKVAKLQAEAQKVSAEVGNTEAKTEETLARTDKLELETDLMPEEHALEMGAKTVDMVKEAHTPIQDPNKPKPAATPAKKPAKRAKDFAK